MQKIVILTLGIVSFLYEIVNYTGWFNYYFCAHMHTWECCDACIFMHGCTNTVTQ